MKHIVTSDVFQKITRWWLTGILVFIPFQHDIVNNFIQQSNKLADFLSYLDEITIVVFFPFVIERFTRIGNLLILHILLCSFQFFS